jgi:hypothetical protein
VSALGAGGVGADSSEWTATATEAVTSAGIATRSWRGAVGRLRATTCRREIPLSRDVTTAMSASPVRWGFETG